MRYFINTTQEFSVVHEVEADSPEQAWDILGGPAYTVLVNQSEGEIIGTWDNCYVEDADGNNVKDWDLG